MQELLPRRCEIGCCSKVPLWSVLIESAVFLLSILKTKEAKSSVNVFPDRPS